MSTGIVTQLLDSYYDFIERYSDPRVKNFFLMSSIFPTLTIVFLYIFFVKKIGPKWMETRKPYELRNTIIVYNIVQMIISTYIFYNSGVYFWFSKYKLFCEPVDYTVNPDALLMVRICYLYFLSKFAELLDTVLFVLRKKSNQISNLHVIHHSMMPLSGWFIVKFVPGGGYSFFEFLNSFVHMIMYGYYLLAALGPKVQKYLWWKKYLTMLQIVQFLMIISHCTIQLFIPNCHLPKPMLCSITSSSVVVLILFLNFYKHTYIAQPSKEKRAATLNLFMAVKISNWKRSTYISKHYLAFQNRRKKRNKDQHCEPNMKL